MGSNNFAKNNFDRNISSIDDLFKLHSLLRVDYPLLKDQSDELLRAIIVLSVSALDNYLHDFYRTEIVEGFLGVGNFNVQFDNIKISIKALKELDGAFSEGEKRAYLTYEVRKIQKTESYESPKSIEHIFRNIDIKNIWAKLSSSIGIGAQNIKDELGLIIDRRNKISHEADWDYFSNSKNPIDLAGVEHVVDFIKKFVDSVELVTP